MLGSHARGRNEFSPLPGSCGRLLRDVPTVPSRVGVRPASMRECTDSSVNIWTCGTVVANTREAGNRCGCQRLPTGVAPGPQPVRPARWAMQSSERGFLLTILSRVTAGRVRQIQPSQYAPHHPRSAEPRAKPAATIGRASEPVTDPSASSWVNERSGCNAAGSRERPAPSSVTLSLRWRQRGKSERRAGVNGTPSASHLRGCNIAQRSMPDSGDKRRHPLSTKRPPWRFFSHT